MTPCAHSRVLSTLHQVPAALRASVRRLDRQLAQLRHQQSALPTPCLAFVQQGKRVRARLLFASAATDISAGAKGSVLVAASAIELAQAASLLHDDIIDRAESRRGNPAMHLVYGAHATVLSGTYLVDLALERIADLPSVARVRLTDAARETARGQLEELTRTYDLNVSIDDRLAIMKRKTASLFAVAAELGGLLTDREPEACTLRRRFGEAAGMLFQIADDVDDILGRTEELGRPPGADLQGGVVSLPLAIVAEGGHRDELASLMGDHRGLDDQDAVARCRTLLDRTGALHETRGLASRFLRKARNTVQAMSPTWGTQWMNAFIDHTFRRIARHVDVSRSFLASSEDA